MLARAALPRPATPCHALRPGRSLQGPYFHTAYARRVHGIGTSAANKVLHALERAESSAGSTGIKMSLTRFMSELRVNFTVFRVC